MLLGQLIESTKAACMFLRSRLQHVYLGIEHKKSNDNHPTFARNTEKVKECIISDKKRHSLGAREKKWALITVIRNVGTADTAPEASFEAAESVRATVTDVHSVRSCPDAFLLL